MKYLSLILLTLLCNFAIAQVNPTPAAVPVATPASEVDVPKTTIEWLETDFQFGTIKQGEKVEHVFKFKNTGNKPLIINSAKGSCGCTVPEYSKEPLAPGKTGEMKVIFNSAGKMGQQSKPVTIIANTEPSQTRVTLSGMVEAPAGTPAPPTQAANPSDHKHPHDASMTDDHKHPHTSPAVPNKVSATSNTKTKASTTSTTTTTKTESQANNKLNKASKQVDKATDKADKAAKKAEKAAQKAKKEAEKAAKKVKKEAEQAAKLK